MGYISLQGKKMQPECAGIGRIGRQLSQKLVNGNAVAAPDPELQFGLRKNKESTLLERITIFQSIWFIRNQPVIPVSSGDQLENEQLAAFIGG